MAACSGRQSAESQGTFDVCREKSFSLQGDAKKVCVCVRERERDCHFLKDAQLCFLFFHPMFYLEAILSHRKPHYGPHSSTDAGGRHSPTCGVMRGHQSSGPQGPPVALPPLSQEPSSVCCIIQELEIVFQHHRLLSHRCVGIAN